MSMCQKWIDYADQFHSILPELFSSKVQIRTIDSELYLRHVQDLDSGIPVNFQMNTRVPENSGPAMAIRDKQIVRRFVDKSHYGVEMRTVNIPFEDDSGCVSLTYNVGVEFEISGSMERIAASSEQISASSEEISKHSNTMSQQFDGMVAILQQAFERSKEMKAVAGVVKDINDQLKLISMNALIEAAHAGEHGRGFSVVASEVRQLSDSSFQQIKRVNDAISFVAGHMDKATKAVSEMSKDLRQQSHSSNDIHEAIADVTESIARLKTILDKQLNLQ